MSEAIVRYSGKPKSNSWVRWMVGRVMRKNQNNLIVVVGKTGSGKTYSALSICETMAKMTGRIFNIHHVIFSLTALMDLINEGNLKSGDAIIFDEPQTSISAKEFQSEANKVFNYLISTFRHKNLTLFFCTPFESLLDKNTRRLFHAKFETMSINRNTNTCRLKPRYIEYSDFRDKKYEKRLIILFNDEFGNPKSEKLSFWDVPLPSKELIEQYELKKNAYTTNLNRNISERLKRFEESGRSITAEHKEPVIKRKPLTAKQELVMRTFANIKEPNRYEVASKILKISMACIAGHKKLSEKKGYTLEEFKKNG